MFCLGLNPTNTQPVRVIVFQCWQSCFSFCGAVLNTSSLKAWTYSHSHRAVRSINYQCYLTCATKGLPDFKPAVKIRAFSCFGNWSNKSWVRASNAVAIENYPKLQIFGKSVNDVSVRRVMRKYKNNHAFCELYCQPIKAKVGLALIWYCGRFVRNKIMKQCVRYLGGLKTSS